MSTVTLGQRVRFRKELVRASVQTRKILPTGEGFDHFTKHVNREWLSIPMPGDKQGIIVGQRTLSNGYSQFETGDWGEGGFYTYSTAESFPAYLIAYDLRRKPALVRVEDVEVLP